MRQEEGRSPGGGDRPESHYKGAPMSIPERDCSSIARPQSQRGRFLTPTQVMDELKLSENTVYRELEYGFLKGISLRCGRQWRISAEGLEKLFSGDR
jgi:Helix-turn-helix domain